MSKMFAYGRVSAPDQDPQLQLGILADCDHVYVDHASSAATARLQLDGLLRDARSGDTLDGWRLDRLGRNMKHLLDSVGDLEDREIGLKSLKEQIDTTSANRRLILHMFSERFVHLFRPEGRVHTQ